jgi:hypothetical protein
MNVKMLRILTFMSGSGVTVAQARQPHAAPLGIVSALP